MFARSILNMEVVDSKVKNRLESNGIRLQTLGGNLAVLKALAGREKTKDLGFFAQHLFFSIEVEHDYGINWSKLSVLKTSDHRLIVSGTIDLWRDAILNLSSDSASIQENKVANVIKSALANEGIVLR